MVTRWPPVLGSENSGASMPTVKFSPGQSGEPGFGRRREGGGIGVGAAFPAAAGAAWPFPAERAAPADFAGCAAGRTDAPAFGSGAVFPLPLTASFPVCGCFLGATAVRAFGFTAAGVFAFGFAAAFAFGLTAFNLAFFVTGRFLADAGATETPVYQCNT
jgi:hypothetical protein